MEYDVLYEQYQKLHMALCHRIIFNGLYADRINKDIQSEGLLLYNYMKYLISTKLVHNIHFKA